MKKTKKRKNVRVRRSQQMLHEDVMGAMKRLVIERGFESISMRGFCTEAKLDHSTFYHYYKNIDDLYMQFAKQTDYWLAEVIPTNDIERLGGKQFLVELIQNLHSALRENKVMQKILLWGLNSNNPTPIEIARQRETDSEAMIRFYEQEFEGSDININVFISMLIASVYYLTLHSENDVSTFVGLDLSKSENQGHLNDMIATLIEHIYQRRDRERNIKLLRETLASKGLSDSDIEECIAIAGKI